MACIEFLETIPLSQKKAVSPGLIRPWFYVSTQNDWRESVPLVQVKSMDQTLNMVAFGNASYSSYTSTIPTASIAEAGSTKNNYSYSVSVLIAAAYFFRKSPPETKLLVYFVGIRFSNWSWWWRSPKTIVKAPNLLTFFLWLVEWTHHDSPQLPFVPTRRNRLSWIYYWLVELRLAYLIGPNTMLLWRPILGQFYIFLMP